MKAEALRPGFSSFKATFRLDIDSFPFNPSLGHCKADLSDKGKKNSQKRISFKEYESFLSSPNLFFINLHRTLPQKASGWWGESFI